MVVVVSYFFCSSTTLKSYSSIVAQGIYGHSALFHKELATAAHPHIVSTTKEMLPNIFGFGDALWACVLNDYLSEDEDDDEIKTNYLMRTRRRKRGAAYLTGHNLTKKRDGISEHTLKKRDTYSRGEVDPRDMRLGVNQVQECDTNMKRVHNPPGSYNYLQHATEEIGQHNGWHESDDWDFKVETGEDLSRFEMGTAPMLSQQK